MEYGKYYTAKSLLQFKRQKNITQMLVKNKNI